MDALLLIARLALAAVFAVAAVGKFMDLPGSQRAMRDFGVPEKYSKAGGLMLPVVELVVAVFLIPVDTARYAALLGFLLLLGFVGGIVWNLRQGRTPDCHCFGQIHSEPVGPRTIIRNGVLAAVALFILVAGWNDPGYALLGWADDLSGFEWLMLLFGLLMLAAIAALGWVVVNMLGQNGRLLLRLDELEQRLTAIGSGEAPATVAPTERDTPTVPKRGLEPGTLAPSFRLKGIHGETMSSESLLAAEKPMLLIFSDPGCGPCNALLPEVATWQQERGDQHLTVILSRGTAATNQEKARAHGLGMLLLQENREVAESFKVAGTPSAVFVNANGTIGSWVAEGSERIRDLVRDFGKAPAPAAAPTRPAQPPARSVARSDSAPGIGTKAPDIALADLDGSKVQLADLFNRETVLIFWSPTCGFCKRMSEDLLAWERGATDESPQAVIITSGDVEANRAFGFASIVLHDPATEAMRLYGTTGTPTAIKIDASGKIASEMRVGQPGVLSLLNNEPMPASTAPSPPKQLAIGDAAPAVKLPDLEGHQFDLESMRGQETALIFWNPGCGFCSRMLDDIKAWESSKPESAPALVFVSTGAVDANQRQGLTSPVLLDQGFKAGRSFGASGTPSAVLVDADGKIASQVAVGAPGVFGLLGRA